MSDERAIPRYERIGRTYTRTRRTDPGIAAAIRAALGDARSVVNVGAGAGSYEPADLEVIAVEPSPTMAAQRPGSSPALIAFAEDLPLEDDCADAATALLTVHHWNDLESGLAEMRRVARDVAVVMTLDPRVMTRSWSRLYAPQLAEADRAFPTPELIAGLLGGRTEIVEVPTAADCADIFIETTLGRPELLLDPVVRANCSGFARMEDELEAEAVAKLAVDLASGEWDRRWGHLRELDEIDGGLRLVVSRS